MTVMLKCLCCFANNVDLYILWKCSHYKINTLIETKHFSKLPLVIHIPLKHCESKLFSHKCNITHLHIFRNILFMAFGLVINHMHRCWNTIFDKLFNCRNNFNLRLWWCNIWFCCLVTVLLLMVYVYNIK